MPTRSFCFQAIINDVFTVQEMSLLDANEELFHKRTAYQVASSSLSKFTFHMSTNSGEVNDWMDYSVYLLRTAIEGWLDKTRVLDCCLRP